MATRTEQNETRTNHDVPPRLVVGGTQRHPVRAATIVYGALAAGAGAGALAGAQALRRRHALRKGRVNSTMAAAMTANDVSPDGR